MRQTPDTMIDATMDNMTDNATPAAQPPAVDLQPTGAQGARALLQPTVMVLVLTFLAFAIRVHRLEFQSLWRDESDALRFATLSLPDFIHMFSLNGQNGPLYFLALRPWLAIAGQSEFALRFPSVIFSTLAVPVTYRLLRRLAGVKPALVLALLMAAAPYLVWYGQEAKMYALLTFLIPLSLWLAVLAVQRGRWYYWVGLYVVTSLSIYTHLLAPLIIPVQALWLLLVPGRAEDPADGGTDPEQEQAEPAPSTRKRVLVTLAYLAVLGLPYLPILRWAVPLWLSWQYRTGFAFTPLPEILQNLAGVWSRGILPIFGLTTMPMLLAVVAGIILWLMAGGRNSWRMVAMLAAWMLLPPIEIFIISLGTPIYVDRYLIWAMPAFLALAALGIVALLHAWRPLGWLTLGVILALNVRDTGAQQFQSLKSDYRSAAHYVMAHRQPSDRLIFQIPYNTHLFQYYSGPIENYAEGPYTNNGMGPDELDYVMASGTSGASDVWLILSEATLWDSRGMTENWLNTHGTVVDRADFTLVSVIRYQMKPLTP